MIQFKSISKKAGFVLAIAGAAVVGGASTALVSASIPGSDGTISACYNKTGGMLNVIDAQAGKTCTNKQNPISWSSSSGGGAPNVVEHDANGQVLGSVVGGGVYAQSLNRIVPLAGSSNDPTKLVVYAGEFGGLYFQTTDCTGQAYVQAGSNVKTVVTRWYSGGNNIYGIVSDSATPSNMTPQSELDWDTVTDDGFSCSSTSVSGSMYPITTVTLPFNTPVQGPLQF